MYQESKKKKSKCGANCSIHANRHFYGDIIIIITIISYNDEVHYQIASG